MDLPDQFCLPRVVWRISTSFVSDAARAGLLQKLPIREGQVLTQDLLDQSLEAIQTFDDHLDIMINNVGTREEILTGHTNAMLKSPPGFREKMTRNFGLSPCDDAVNFTIYDKVAFPQRIKIEPAVQARMLITQTRPSFSLAPGEEGGVVQLAILVTKAGTVAEVDPLAGPSHLIQPAVDAVRQWQYHPTRLNGIRVEVRSTVEVDFTA
ncbi:MAG TPA: energy transducer TonB [Bryobacteraceae bacterium]|nr:energy transducer TonB [Bryobacteraceae bacterium]